MATAQVMRRPPPARRAVGPRRRPPRSSSRSRTRAVAHARESVGDELGDAEEAEPPGEERRDGDLVRRVERAGWTPPRSPASRASASIGNVSRSGAWNSSVSAVRSSGGTRRRCALGIGERVRDRHAHVRIAEVRERRAVAEANERVHDRRRVDDDLDPLVRHAEEEVRLDHLEPLVGERGRVDRDLRAHPPGRVGERLLGGDVAELVARASAERAAGGGQDEARDLVGRRAREALVERRVLAVDGKDASAAPRHAPRARARRRRRGSPCWRARGRRRARASRASREGPAKPTTALRTTSGSARSSSSTRSPPTCFSGASTSSSGDDPEATAQSSSPGCASTISIACRPIEPVAPSRATRFTGSV